MDDPVPGREEIRSRLPPGATEPYCSCYDSLEACRSCTAYKRGMSGDMPCPETGEIVLWIDTRDVHPDYMG